LTDRPLAFASSTECALTHAGTSSMPLTAPLPSLLSWDSRRLPVDSPSASTPTDVPKNFSFGSRLPHRPLVPTLRSLIASPVSSADGLWVCCTPLPTRGSLRFHESRPARGRPEGCPRSGARRIHFPAARFTPLEELHSPAAVPCHHGLCLPGVRRHPTPRHDPGVAPMQPFPHRWRFPLGKSVSSLVYEPPQRLKHCF
jgi:hypothetical protein